MVPGIARLFVKKCMEKCLNNLVEMQELTDVISLYIYIYNFILLYWAYVIYPQGGVGVYPIPPCLTWWLPPVITPVLSERQAAFWCSLVNPCAVLGRLPWYV